MTNPGSYEKKKEKEALFLFFSYNDRVLLLQVFFQSKWKSDCVAQEGRTTDWSENTSQPGGYTETEQTLPLWYSSLLLTTVLSSAGLT